MTTTAPDLTELQANAQKLIINYLAAHGLDEFTADRVFVIGSARTTSSPITQPWLDFEIDERHKGRWFRVTYSLLMDANQIPLALYCVSPSGIPLNEQTDTVGHDMARLPVGDNKCNGYDLAFLAWYQRHGWQIHQTPAGIDVWVNGDVPKPFTVTRGMIERLEWNGHIERIFPSHAAVLDYVWILKQ